MRDGLCLRKSSQTEKSCLGACVCFSSMFPLASCKYRWPSCFCMFLCVCVWGGGGSRACLFVFIGELVETLFSNPNYFCFFQFFFCWGCWTECWWVQTQHRAVLPQGFLAVTQQHLQDCYSLSYPEPEFFIWSHCLLLNSHLWGD